ncbi:hypothetical protein [Jiangella aurantiaca]|nr:hypothetical protein [Jiangella aurantiaca]
MDPNPSPLLRSHSTDPHTPATVHGLHHNGLLRVHLTDIGGAIDEYELTVEHALHLAQRLRDAATAMQAFAATRPHAR